MNAKYFLLIVAIAAITVCSTNAQSTYSVWDGKTTQALAAPKGNVYEIRSAAQLAALAKDTSQTAGKTYILKANIDLAGHDWQPIGIDPDPVPLDEIGTAGPAIDPVEKLFCGNFDGGGFTIKGLKLPDAKYSGLFGYIRGVSQKQKSVIKNLQVELFDSIVTGTKLECAGVLAGNAINVAISNISVAGNMHIKATQSVSVGGITGLLSRGNISVSASNINLTVETADGNAHAGGIAGLNSGIISSCYSTGNIKAEPLYYAYAGGIAAYNHNADGSAKITSCYAAGDITAVSKQSWSHAGGIVGMMDEGTTIENCAALNKNVITTAPNGKSFAGRVAGLESQGTFKNNAANFDMLVKQNEQQTKDFNNNTRHGVSVKLAALTGPTSASIYVRAGTLKANTNGAITAGGLGWDPKIWAFPEGRLPKLR